MAIEPNAPPNPLAESGAPAIENELPTYRAISPMAVASLVFGISSVFCYADFWFLVCAALAVVTGVMALAKLRSYGDVLTGANLAKAGITLALIFSISSLTIGGVQTFLRNRGATEFALAYARILNSGKADDILWYRLPPFQRRGVTPGEFGSQIRKSREPGPYQELGALIDRMLLRVNGPPKKTIKFDRVDYTRLDKTTNEAVLLYRIDGPAAKDEKPGEDLILVEIHAEESPQRPNWYVANIVFPYTAKGYNPRAKEEAAEKAHGHAH